MKQALTKEQKERIELWIFDNVVLELSSDPKIRELQVEHALRVLRGCNATLSSPVYGNKYRELLKIYHDPHKVICNMFIHRGQLNEQRCITTSQQVDELIDRFINISLDRIEIFPDTLLIRYHVPSSDIFRDAQRVHLKSLENIATRFQQRGFDIKYIDSYGIRIVFDVKRAVYTLEQAERLNKILSTKRNKD